MQDITIRCNDCGQEFVWTTGEQEFYQDKKLPQPDYCLICRGRYAAKKQDPGGHLKKKSN